MGDRVAFEMSEAQLTAILEAVKPLPVMYPPGGIPMGLSQQERANVALRRLGDAMGFDAMTMRPIPGKGCRFFTAERTGPVDRVAVAEARREGVIEGMRRYAWWRDGVEYVGTCGTTLAQAIADEMARKP